MRQVRFTARLEIMAQWTCDRCCGTGYASAARDSGMEDAPRMLRPIGIYSCPTCGGTGKRGFTDEQMAALLSTAERQQQLATDGHNAEVWGAPPTGGASHTTAGLCPAQQQEKDK